MKLFFTILIALIANSLLAQTTRQAKWQQQANYTISVTLDDTAQTLEGKETIEYTNNSPDELKEIYIHLFPNAYRNNSTGYAKENVAKGEMKYWMSEEKDRGAITNLDFMVDGEKVILKYSNITPDNAKLILKKPVASGQTIKITTPFKVKIPFTFSRMGHVGQSYQISQWFPKVAVYDINKWNQICYLDQGEFYSDYGNYDVTITLPKNYVVAATGNLQNESELNWLKERAENKRKIINEFDDSETKTLRYTENNIHDFAFFADKRWCVAMEEITLPSGKKVMAYGFDTIYSEAKRGVGYIKKTILYLSERVGEYPYQTAKSCTGALEAGAGMEYPTVTVVGHQHETEVVHEIGHNWFYGIFGSNERRYPWMDEGINTFYELQICTEDDGTGLNNVIKKVTGNDFIYNNTNITLLMGKINTSRGDDAPINRTSQEFSSINYAALIYFRTALNFGYLKSYLGEGLFDQCMQNYYAAWNHKHPLPGDIQDCFEKTTGTNLDWFFNGMLADNQNYDLKIGKIIKENNDQELEIHLKNKSGKAIAVPLKASNNEGFKRFWIDPFAHDTIIHIHNDHYTKIELNDSDYYVEINTNNNVYYLNKASHHACPPQLRLGVGIENKYHRTIFVAPFVGYNDYNKLMTGIAFFNSTLVRKKAEYLIAPMYSYAKKNINGYASFSYTFMHRGATINSWIAGIRSAKFDAQTNSASDIHYLRVQPYLQFNITKPSNNSKLQRYFRIDYTNINSTKAIASDSTYYDKKTSFINLSFVHENNTLLNPYKFKVWVEKNLDNPDIQYIKAAIKAQYKLSYDNPKKKLAIDLFIGKMYYTKNNNKGNYDFYLGAENPAYDYKYWYTATNRTPGNLNPQIMNEQGGVRSNVLAFNTPALSATLRLRTHLPFTNLVRPYLDLGTYKGLRDNYDTKFFYTSGISLVLMEDVLEINFPLAFVHKTDVAGNTQYEVMKVFRSTQSDIINSTINASSIKYWETITFLVNLDKLNPILFIRNFSLGN